MKLSSYDIECLENVKAKMDTDIRMHYSIAELAEVAGMGETRLKALFKKRHGMGLYEYLREERLKKAKLLIDTSEKTIKHISREVGFAYMTNFTAAFKKKFGKAPGELRKAAGIDLID